MKTITTENIVLAYDLLKGASLKGLDNAGKYAVLKICKVLKGIAVEFEAWRNDVMERLRDERFGEMQELALKWKREGDDTMLTKEDKIAVNAYFDNYNNQVNECIGDEVKKENEVELTLLTKEQFGTLIDANDKWNVEQIMLLEDMLI